MHAPTPLDLTARSRPPGADTKAHARWTRRGELARHLVLWTTFVVTTASLAGQATAQGDTPPSASRDADADVCLDPQRVRAMLNAHGWYVDQPKRALGDFGTAWRFTAVSSDRLRRLEVTVLASTQQVEAEPPMPHTFTMQVGDRHLSIVEVAGEELDTSTLATMLRCGVAVPVRSVKAPTPAVTDRDGSKDRGRAGAAEASNDPALAPAPQMEANTEESDADDSNAMVTGTLWGLGIGCGIGLILAPLALASGPGGDAAAIILPVLVALQGGAIGFLGGAVVEVFTFLTEDPVYASRSLPDDLGALPA